MGNVQLSIQYDSHDSNDINRKVYHAPVPPVVRAGKELQGAVLVKTRKDITDGLFLILKGKETTWVDYKRGKDNKSAQEKHTFFETQVELTENQTQLTAGTHSFDFTVILPDHLPTSTYSREHLRHGIYYKCEAQLGKKKKAEYFQVVAAKAPSGNMIQTIKGPETYAVTRRKGSRMPKEPGSIAWGAAIDNTQLGRGDTCNVSISCRNLSSVDITHVHFKLVEEMLFIAKDHQKFERKEMIKIDKTAKTQLPEYMTKSNQKYLDGSSYYADIQNDLESQISSVCFSLSPELYDGAHDSYWGKLIFVAHSVEVEFQLSPGYHPLAIKIPVEIKDFEQTHEQKAL